MYPFLPADVTFEPTAAGWALVLDASRLEVTHVQADWLLNASGQLRGRLPLSDIAVHPEESELIIALHEAGIVFNLHICQSFVATCQFSAYLQARIQGWRTELGGRTGLETSSDGSVDRGYLQGILLEEYHYARKATSCRAPLPDQACGPIRRLVQALTCSHGLDEQALRQTLTRWGISGQQLDTVESRPATEAMIAMHDRLARESLLDYLAGAAVLELDREVLLLTVGDPDEGWAARYDIHPHVLAPIQHRLTEHVAAGSWRVFQEGAWTLGGSISLTDAVSAERSAFGVSQGLRRWRRSTVERYRCHSDDLPAHALGAECPSTRCATSRAAWAKVPTPRRAGTGL
jgi:hypothetical protein